MVVFGVHIDHESLLIVYCLYILKKISSSDYLADSYQALYYTSIYFVAAALLSISLVNTI